MTGRLCVALGLLVFLAACGGGPGSPPRNLDDACSIVSQRPNYLKAMQRTERKWGVPVAVQMAMIHQESKFDGDARTPLRFAVGVIPMGRQSSAYGYSQALDATWEEYQQTEGGRGTRRDNFNDASDFMGWYMAETQELLGIPLHDARRQYLAYHEGRAGYSRGSYRSKAWLTAIAQNVATRASMYQVQLELCGRA